ncbi:MAG: hypothetical protein ACQERD_08310 [Campylobacterota bacterium]
MADWDSIADDALIEEYEKQIIEEYVNDENVEEFEFDKKCKLVVASYQIPDRIDNSNALYNSTLDDELEMCKQLLKPISSDLMPLQRQVGVFTNLINLKWLDLNDMYEDEYKGYKLYKYNYYRILECAFEDNIIVETKNLFINTFIPKKHYENKLKEIYNQSPIDKLQIPLENSTEYLQELFDIWIQHTVYSKTAYQIAEEFVAYATNGSSYDKTQITRKLASIKKLLK